jgi:hypothetical protein
MARSDSLDPQQPADEVIPIGVWVRMQLPDHPAFTGFTYVDPQAGLSAKGWFEGEEAAGPLPSVTVRLPIGVPCEPLGEDEVRRRDLPDVAEWLKFYGPQPKSGTLWGWWRRHPKLQGRFHPEYPDDLQVLVHDGGPRLTDRRPELVWVRVTGGEGDVFTGQVLNRPHQLVSVSEGSAIRFIVPDGGEHPLLVTEKYLAERPGWDIQPCNRCGLSELLDAPSDLIRVVFPHTPPDVTMSAFTAFCGACGGILVLSSKGLAEEGATAPPSPRKKWWQLWK